MTKSNQTIQDTVKLIADGAMSCTELTESCNSKIASTESEIGAWAHHNPELALQQAAQLDQDKSQKPLHGIPVGLKDIFDSADYPTEHGSIIHKRRRPEKDCAVIEQLKAAGSVIMGKTVTTEFAFFNPSRTCNPLNTRYSPGGSSSGSAAAVAAGHVPVAVGSQTNGSVIRPASFCGVYGFKPSRGLISRSGVLETSTTLDHVGLFARNLDDIASVTDALSAHDPADNASYAQPRPSIVNHLRELDLQQPNSPASIVWIDMPYSDRYSDDANSAFESLTTKLKDSITRIAAPDEFTAYLDAHKVIYDYEIVRALDNEISNHWLDISETARPIFAAARHRTETEYLQALKVRDSAIDWFSKFNQQYDAILTPSAVAEAPLMGSTGDPVCCTIWTLCGLPCITLPLLQGKTDMPIGVQLVGALKSDHLLIGHARQLLADLKNTT